MDASDAAVKATERASSLKAFDWFPCSSPRPALSAQRLRFDSSGTSNLCACLFVPLRASSCLFVPRTPRTPRRLRYRDLSAEAQAEALQKDAAALDE